MHYDPKTGNYLLVRQHDSWLSVDPVVGCSYHCRYCILRLDNLTQRKPQRVVSVEKAIRAVTTSPYFSPGLTVISYGNNTDAFLPDNVEGTLAFIRAFRSAGYVNPIAIATKAPISERIATELHRTAGSSLLLFVSYSGLGSEIERGVDESLVKANFTTLSGAGVTALHFWRPLVPANGNLRNVSEVVKLVSRYSKASVCIGLKYSPRLYKIFQDSEELSLPPRLGSKYGNYLEDGIVSNILSVAERDCPGYPIYFRTACAVAYVLSRSDYIAALGTEACKVSRCHMNQRTLCEKASRVPDRKEIDSILSQIGLGRGYSITSDGIEFMERLCQDDYIFLLHNLRCRIHANITRTTEWKGQILPESS